MVNFNNLKALQVDANDTAVLVLHDVKLTDNPVVLHVALATADNKDYFNALMAEGLSGGSRRSRTAATGQNELVSKSMDLDKKLYPEYVIKNWENVVDAKGDSVDFSTEACKDFLTAVPQWVLDDIRLFCTNPLNFTNTALKIDPVDLEDKSKN